MKTHLHCCPKLCVSILLVFAGVPCFAQGEVEDSSLSGANIFYLDVSTMLVGGSISLNYERTWERFGIRFGAGTGALLETGSGSGFMAMAMVYPAADRHFDMGAGLSLMQMSRSRPSGPEGTRLYPAFTMCYRIQPREGGFFLRVGFSYVFYQGTPFTLSIGSTF
jgi:hypothetical protein